MKKIKLVFFVLLILINCTSFSFGATKEDVIAALNQSYYVSEAQPSFRLSSKYINRGVKYLNEHPLTSQQYDGILAAINKGVAFARQVGHTRYREYTKEQYNTALSIILEACSAADVDLEEELQKTEVESSSSAVSTPPTTTVSEGKTVDNKPVIIQENHENNEIVVIVSGEVIPDVILDEDNNYKNSSGEIIVYSGEVKIQETQSQSPVSTITSTKTKNISKMDQIMAILIGIVVIVIIVNFFLIRLIFKKKWNRIIKVILEIILVVGTLALIIGLGVIVYYYDIIKKMLQLYFYLHR